ncbi:MAG: secretin N-terminal domain-containing protein [Pirellulaceae bacterium]
MLSLVFAASSTLAQQQHESTPERTSKTIAINNLDATTIRALLEPMFDFNSPTSEQDGRTAMAQDGRTLMALQLAVDYPTNSLIVAGPTGDIDVVQNLVDQLDIERAREWNWTVYQLQNAPAEDVYSSLENWQKSRLQTEDQTAAPILIPEPVSNSVIIACSDDADRQELDKVIRSLDQGPDLVQVKLTVKQMIDGEEVTLTRPTITTLDNMQGTVQVDGLTIELLPTVVRTTKEPKVTHVPSK